MAFKSIPLDGAVVVLSAAKRQIDEMPARRRNCRNFIGWTKLVKELNVTL